MIEIPAAAFELTALCHELDFFSIGSNDLLHYFTATDRGAPTALDDPLAPAFLRLLKKIVDETHAASRWIGLCGEMGANAQSLPLFVGLGLDEISVPAESIALIKDRLAPLLAAECRRLLTEALDCMSADEVRALLQQREPRRPLPLLAEEFVFLDSLAATRAEAIKTLCDILYVTGRADSPRQIEDAIWRREAVYSTGFGHGFAIPHCKSGAVAANSLCILRLRHPIPWGDGDAGVNVVVLLVIRENDQAAESLKIISRLARLLMDETFRKDLASAKSPAAMTEFLAAQINVSGSL
jgi:fructose-specific PTS system IIA-like component